MKKILFKLLFFLLLINNGFAQRSIENTFVVDYTLSDENFMSSQAFSWSLRTNYTYQGQGDYILNYSVAVLDSLIEPDLTTHLRSNILSYNIDTVHTLFAHTNTSGDTNSIIFYLIDLGGNNYPDIDTDVVLWEDTLRTDTSFFGINSWNTYDQKDFHPNLTGLAPTQKVGLVCEFNGSDGDTLGLLYSYFPGEICDSVSLVKSEKSKFWPHSYSFYNPNDSLYPRPNNNDLFIDCNNNSIYDTNDGDSYLQNIEFWFTVTTVECNLSTSIAVEQEVDNGCDGKITVTATGDATPYTYLWDSNANNQTTATATGLCVGNYCVTVTNQDGCQNIECLSVHPLGYNQNYLQKNIHVFPNPSNGEITVTLNGVEADDYTFTVINVLGETVLNENVNAAGNYTKAMNLSNLGKGIYMLTVANSKAKSTHKLTIK